MKPYSVRSHMRRPENYAEYVATHDRLRAEVANFDHVPVILEAELETALKGFRGEAIDMPEATRAREAM